MTVTTPLLATFSGITGAATVIVYERGMQAAQNVAQGTYTATEIATFIAALGVLITGTGAVIVNIIVALKQGRRVEALTHSVAEVHQEAKIITAHVNSAATASNVKIDGLQKEIEALKMAAADMKSVAALLAQSQAQAARAPARGTDPPASVQAPSLEQPTSPEIDALKTELHKIEVNTRETVNKIETNTRETVDQLKDLNEVTAKPKPGE